MTAESACLKRLARRDEALQPERSELHAEREDRPHAASADTELNEETAAMILMQTHTYCDMLEKHLHTAKRVPQEVETKHRANTEEILDIQMHKVRKYLHPSPSV